jgi:hypothetical protein
MNVGAALTGALLTTLATPETWLLALGVFLIRGGIVLVVLPIVVLPSPVGLANVLGPTLVTIVLRGVSAEIALLVGVIALAIVGWVVVGGLAAATLEAAGAGSVARGEAADEPALRPTAADPVGEGNDGDRPDRRVAPRILVARVVAHVPTGLALVWAAARLTAVAYRELTSPLDVTTPIIVRVLRGAPEVVAVLVVLWVVGEILGAVAARRIALDDEPVPAALRWSVARIVRQPVATFVAFGVPIAALGFVLGSTVVAAAAGWGVVRAALRSMTDRALEGTATVILFVSIWLVGLLLIAVTAAWRSAVWSVAHRDLWSRRAGSAATHPD